MPVDPSFRYNAEAKPSLKWGDAKPGLAGDTLGIVVNAATRSTATTRSVNGFEAKLPWIDGWAPIPQIKDEPTLGRWLRTPMDWWQTQANFAVWCASSGCGVGVEHLEHQNPLIRAMYRWHLVYQARRILVELKAPQPTDVSFDAASNPYDRRAYEGLCRAFGVDPKNEAMFRVDGPNSGAGRNYIYVTRVGYQPAWPSGEAAMYVPGHHSFTKATGGSTLHIDYVWQDQIGPNDWTKLVPAKTDGFTLEGVQRLNDSIRTYVWAVLGAQGQTRSAILGSDSTRFDAQKQFEANVEDAISAPVDLPAAIARYQDALQYAGSQVNFAYGLGLLMSPSDMVLPIARGVAGYNNKVLTADSVAELGHQPDINSEAVVAAPPPSNAVVPADDFAEKINPPQASSAEAGQPTITVPTAELSSAPAAPVQSDHEDEKIALALVVTGLFAAAMYYWRGRLI